MIGFRLGCVRLLSPPSLPTSHGCAARAAQGAGHHGTGAVPCGACGASRMPKARAGTSRPRRSLQGEGQAFHHALSADGQLHGKGQRALIARHPPGTTRPAQSTANGAIWPRFGQVGGLPLLACIAGIVFLTVDTAATATTAWIKGLRVRSLSAVQKKVRTNHSR